ncbi:MAG: beta-lactamase family protein [Oscillospiraceae bacterium]|nr:beta-lactamase family protein [Oscillospiraceae bacterium]
MPKTKQAVEQAAQLKLYPAQLDVLEERLLEWIAQDKYQALVIRAARYGVPVFEGCYGTSTHEYGVKSDTIFPIFSCTKPITAALIFKLLEEGRLELSNYVSTFLPEYTGGGREKTNLAHLLTHTHGVDDEFWKSADNYVKEELKVERPGENSTGEDWDKYNSDLRKAMGLPEDYKDVWDAVCLRVELKNTPGKVMAYSNYGYDRLKEIICAITGESIDSYARRVLFEPLGMIDSHWVLPEEKWGRVLGRNERCMGYGYINSERCYKNEGGGNGLKTTVNDTANFCEMILNDGRFNGRRILSPASIRQMTSNYNTSLPNQWDSWALGWNYRGTKVDDAGVLRSPGSVEHGGWAGHKISIDGEQGLSVICYSGVYNDDSFYALGMINNMIIAACE